ncbi:MAG: hypothetical protein IJU03_09500 [Thermoguttaceae bacterium]|nr:hypothetical protein [Thermoguttaceae bacterium]
MKKFYFNSINSVKSGNSGSASASPKARKLRMESLENRHLLAVGAPFPDACVEPDVSASAFYATETVGSSTSGATAIDISSALAEDSTVPDFVDEFDSTSADDLIQFSDDSEPEDELIDEYKVRLQFQTCDYRQESIV